MKKLEKCLCQYCCYDDSSDKLSRKASKKLRNVLTDCFVGAVKNKEELNNQARELTRTYFSSSHKSEGGGGIGGSDKCSVTEGDLLVKALMSPNFDPSKYCAVRKSRSDH